MREFADIHRKWAKVRFGELLNKRWFVITNTISTDARAFRHLALNATRDVTGFVLDTNFPLKVSRCLTSALTPASGLNGTNQ